MCPACITTTAVIVAGAGSTGAILAASIGRFKQSFIAKRLSLFHEAKEK
jgi:hypothetical protein